MAKQLIANSWLTEPRIDNQNTVGESLCQREHAPDCDINVQIKRFQALGVSPFRPLDPAACRDLSELHEEFIQANNVLVAAREAFDELDDHIKQRFSGSPAQYLEFMSNLSENSEEALRLGLIEARSPPATPLRQQAKGATAPEAVPPTGGTQGTGA